MRVRFACAVNLHFAGKGISSEHKGWHNFAAAPKDMLIAASSLSAWMNVPPTSGMRRAIQAVISFWGVIG